MAQSNVQLTGALDAYVGSLKAAGDSASKKTVGGGGLSTSWFGLTGSEDMGGGLKATFALTSFFQINTGAQGSFPGDNLFSRDANLGLSGNFGTVKLGRDLAPNFVPTLLFNPFGDSYTFSPLMLHANVPLFNGTSWGATTPSDTGWNNEVIYSIPSIGGLSVNLHYQFGGLANDSSKKNIGFNAFYDAGPLSLTAFYERDQISNPLVPNIYLGTTKKDWMLGGTYDFTVVKAYLTYGQAKADNTNAKATTTSLGASVPVGTGQILAGMARTAISVGGNTRTTATVGYDYNFSKSTDVYAMVMNDKITNFSSGNSLGLGIRKKF